MLTDLSDRYLARIIHKQDVDLSSAEDADTEETDRRGYPVERVKLK